MTVNRSFCWREFIHEYDHCTECGRALACSAEASGFEAASGLPRVRLIYTCPEQHMAIYTEPVAVAI